MSCLQAFIHSFQISYRKVVTWTGSPNSQGTVMILDSKKSGHAGSILRTPLLIISRQHFGLSPIQFFLQNSRPKVAGVQYSSRFMIHLQIFSSFISCPDEIVVLCKQGAQTIHIIVMSVLISTKLSYSLVLHVCSTSRDGHRIGLVYFTYSLNL